MAVAVVLLTISLVLVVALLAAAGAGKLARMDGATYPAAGFVHRFRQQLFSASGGTRAVACSMFTRSDSTRARR
ncbi:hypothetical protein [Streptomyces sp. NPDC001275]